MAKKFKDKYGVPDALPIILDVYPQNQFDETFGIWPDNMVAFKNGKFIFRGVICLDGSRQKSHSQQLLELLATFKY